MGPTSLKAILSRENFGSEMSDRLRLNSFPAIPLLPALNSPLRIAAASFVLSELITGGILWLISGSLSVQALTIAGVCSVLAPLLLSSRLIRQQKTIHEKNRQLHQLANKFRMANARLVEQNAQLDAFSYTVAHDLQSPLNAIAGLSRLLEENFTTAPPEMIREHLRMIGRTTDKMNRIVEDLLLLAQVKETEKLPLEPLDMALIVDEAIASVGHAVDEYAAELSIPREWPQAIGYAPWVEQVWINYIGNALKYGGRPPIVRIGATAGKHTVCFWVQDNGRGLTREQREALFIPFQRLDQQRLKGHGVGLSIVRNIVERLGGEVGVESSAVAGEGCRFYFTLPRAVKSSIQELRFPSTPLRIHSSMRSPTPRELSSINPHNRERDLTPR